MIWQFLESNDEISQFQTGRYVSSNEGIWRILGFHVHERFPAVVHLTVHLENGQRVHFNETNLAERILNPPITTLTAFFNLCQQDDFARTLLYSEIPQYYTWDSSNKKFSRRKQGTVVPGFNIRKSETI